MTALRDQRIGQACAAHGGCRVLDEAERAHAPANRLNLWRVRLMGSMSPTEYEYVVSSGIAARDHILAGFALIDRTKAEEKRRREEAIRAEFTPVQVPQIPVTVRRPRLTLAR